MVSAFSRTVQTDASGIIADDKRIDTEPFSQMKSRGFRLGLSLELPCLHTIPTPIGQFHRHEPYIGIGSSQFLRQNPGIGKVGKRCDLEPQDTQVRR